MSQVFDRIMAGAGAAGANQEVDPVRSNVDESCADDEAKILSVSNGEQGTVQLIWRDGHSSRFHLSWLRDNCACPLCCHPDTFERMTNPLSVPDNITALMVSVDNVGRLVIIWDDSHRSVFEPGWLYTHCYSDEKRASRQRAPRLIHWGSELPSCIPGFLYDDVMSNNQTLLEWLLALHTVGIALLREVPGEDRTVMRAAQRISYVRRTNFGSTFDVRPKRQPNSNAYTSLWMPLHTDLPQYELQAGYQFFHCLENSVEGGESLLVDGFKLADALRRDDPQAFEMLSRWPIHFHFRDQDSDLSHRGTVITLDANQEVTAIRFSPALAAPLDVPFALMPSMRRAYHKFYAMTHDPQLQARMRLQPGDMLVNDNYRVLHARSGFDPSSGERHLQGCYVDKSELMSRIRVLRRELSPGS
ncbi:MAG: TauD/TfdA family dioxygenase [Gammaproteobacteria bacterium]